MPSEPVSPVVEFCKCIAALSWAKRKICKKPKGRDFFAGVKGKSKKHKKEQWVRFRQKGKGQKKQKWQIALAMGAIRVA